MREELIDLYNTANSNEDLDSIRHFQRARERIAPQIIIEEIHQHEALKSRYNELLKEFKRNKKPILDSAMFIHQINNQISEFRMTTGKKPKNLYIGTEVYRSLKDYLDFNNDEDRFTEKTLMGLNLYVVKNSKLHTGVS